MHRLLEKVKRFPDKPGVYIFREKSGKVIYVGKANSLKKRVSSYFGASMQKKAYSIVNRASDVEYIITAGELGALLLENNLIKKYRPRYNVLLRDDKQYPYIKITLNEEWPRILIVRKIEDDGAAYFGPYRGQTARDIIKMFKRLLQLRWCKNFKKRNEPCFYYHLKKCLGPCIGEVQKQEYMKIVNEAVDFLEGKLEVIIEKLKVDMDAASHEQEYEKAARLRDRIRAFERMLEHQDVLTTEKIDRDVVAFIALETKAMFLVLQIRKGKLIGRESYFIADNKGEEESSLFSSVFAQYYTSVPRIPDEIVIDPVYKKLKVLTQTLLNIKGKGVKLVFPSSGTNLRVYNIARTNVNYLLEQNLKLKTGIVESLSELQKIIGSTKLPERIEAFDISTIMGKETVGSMVVFEEGAPCKSDYRKFKIYLKAKADDVTSMKEVINRRYSGSLTKNLPLPDMIVVDGGIPQVSAARVAVRGTTAEGIPIIGLAKKMEQIYFIGKRNPLTLPRRSPALKLLQRIRDEAHRFAIAYHKLRRKKAMLEE